MNLETLADLAALAASVPSPMHARAGLHVLVVDDDALVRRMVAHYLSDYDIRVTALENGSDVASVLERHSIDLLILDLKLPGEDGMQIARRVRAQSDVPIVMLTGRKDEADRVMALEL